MHASYSEWCISQLAALPLFVSSSSDPLFSEVHRCEESASCKNVLSSLLQKKIVSHSSLPGFAARSGALTRNQRFLLNVSILFTELVVAPAAIPFSILHLVSTTAYALSLRAIFPVQFSKELRSIRHSLNASLLSLQNDASSFLTGVAKVANIAIVFFAVYIVVKVVIDLLRISLHELAKFIYAFATHFISFSTSSIDTALAFERVLGFCCDLCVKFFFTLYTTIEGVQHHIENTLSFEIELGRLLLENYGIATSTAGLHIEFTPERFSSFLAETHTDFSSVVSRSPEMIPVFTSTADLTDIRKEIASFHDSDSVFQKVLIAEMGFQIAKALRSKSLTSLYSTEDLEKLHFFHTSPFITIFEKARIPPAPRESTAKEEFDRALADFDGIDASTVPEELLPIYTRILHSEKTPIGIFGIEGNTSSNDVKKQYRKDLLITHPDRAPYPGSILNILIRSAYKCISSSL